MPASNGPCFWSFVTGSTTPAALIGDWLASVYDLKLTSTDNSVAPAIEYKEIALLRELFDLLDHFEGLFKGISAIRAAFSNWPTEAARVEIAWRAMNECLFND